MTGLVQHPTRVGFDPLGRRLTKLIKTGIKDGSLSRLNANVIWTVLFGIPVGYVRDWLDGYNPVAPSKVAHELAELCVKALRNDRDSTVNNPSVPKPRTP